MKKTIFLLPLLFILQIQNGEAITVNSTYSYDDMNRLTNASYSSGLDLSYSYDPAGNILGVSGSFLQGYNLTLGDVIQYLQVLTGDKPTDINIYHDIDSDNKIGLPEAINALKKIAE